MKTYCKHTGTTDPAFVRDAIEAWLKGKRNRRSVKRFIAHHPDVDKLAREIAREIAEDRLMGLEIHYFDRIEPLNGKHRVIGVESPRHQIYDYVAALALKPLFDAKIGRWQTAGVKGRGIEDARRAIRRRVCRRDCRWFVKLDVRKCYPSIRHDLLLSRLEHDVGDRTLIRLVARLVEACGDGVGLNIGSYLSQWLANYYLSYAYHYATERLHRTRRSKHGDKRVRLVNFCLFYMDDILLTGTSRKDVEKAARMLDAYFADELGLHLHAGWHAARIGAEPIDMVGYRFTPHHTDIRKNVYRRARHAFIEAQRNPMTEKLARKCASYYGYYTHADLERHRRTHHINKTMREARRRLRETNRPRRPN